MAKTLCVKYSHGRPPMIHGKYSVSPLYAILSIVRHRHLIFEQVRRDVIGRYRGSIMGLLWSFFTPVLMLCVYTFVFSVIFNSRWAGGTGAKSEFAIVLFVGLMIFNLFSECINKAPLLIQSNPNYVKKVLFPLETLPVANMGASLFHFGVSALVWIVFSLAVGKVPPANALLIPVILLPLVLLILGISWMLSSLGVYLRDVGQFIGVVTTAMMFLSPIFYPMVALPEGFRPYFNLNPLTYYVEQARDLMIWGKGVDWTRWSKHLLVSSMVFILGFAWFQRTRKGFADVI